MFFLFFRNMRDETQTGLCEGSETIVRVCQWVCDHYSKYGDTRNIGIRVSGQYFEMEIWKIFVFEWPVFRYGNMGDICI